MKPDVKGNVTFLQEGGKNIFRFKRMGWNRSNVFTFLFALAWNGIIWGVFLDKAIVIFLVPFMAIGVLLLILPLFLAYGKRSLIVDADYIIFQIAFFGYKHKRKRYTYEIQSIDHVQSKHENVASTIVVQTNSSYPLQFGRLLSEEEKEWIVERLMAIKEKYFSQVET